MGQASAHSRHYWLGGKRTYEQDRFFEQALDPALWQAGSADHWHACWYTGMPEPGVFRHTGPDRKINHIPGNSALTNKGRLYDTVVAMRDRILDQYGPEHAYTSRLDFLPKVFSMPRDYHTLQQAVLDAPGRRWILKPKNAARGKGVRVLRDVAGIPLDGSWMVQEYLERPHTMQGRKYVLRLYVLIASTRPLRVYLYEQGFAKLASAPYDIDDLDNIYSHLANPDVNALNTDAEVPVEFVDFDRYRRWLREQGHDDETLFRRIRDLVTLTTIAAVEPMRIRSKACGADPRGCYELLGIDCLVDERLKPWLLECNLSPSMEVCAGPDSGGVIEEQVKGKLVADMVSLVGLNETDADEFAADAVAQVRQAAKAELARAGGFQRLYPDRDCEAYLPFFALPRLPDMMLADAVATGPVERPRLQSRHAVELVTDDQIALYEAHTGRVNRLNDSASFTWLMAMEGHAPDQIADMLRTAACECNVPDAWTVRNEVWDCLAEWAEAALVAQRPVPDTLLGEPSARPQPESHVMRQPKSTATSYSAHLACGARRFICCTDSQPVAVRLSNLLAPMETTSGDESASRLEVVRDMPGYTLIFDGEVMESRVPLSAVTPLLAYHLVRRAMADGEVLIDAGLVVAGSSPDSAGILFVHAEPGTADRLALHFARAVGAPFARGLRLPLPDKAQGYAIGLPAQVALATADGAGMFPGRSTSGTEPLCHRLHNGRDGYLTSSDAAALRARHSVGSVIVPDYPTTDESEGLRSASVGEALGHLLPACFTADRRPLDTTAVQSLTHWLGRCERYVVDMSDTDTALARLRAATDTATLKLGAYRTA